MAWFAYNPLGGEWSLLDDISANYIAFGMASRKAKRRLGRQASISLEYILRMQPKCKRDPFFSELLLQQIAVKYRMSVYIEFFITN